MAGDVKSKIRLRSRGLFKRERERVCVEIVRHTLIDYPNNYLGISRAEAEEFLKKKCRYKVHEINSIRERGM